MGLRLLQPPTNAREIPRLPTAHEIEQLRHQLMALRDGKNPRIAGRAVLALKYLDIVTAKTAAERHEKIRELPVTVVHSTPTDGRNGIVKKFVVRGETRFEFFIPAPTSVAASEPAPGGGPSVAAGTGRWKLDGYGNCYWDAEDDGPNQCWPDTGRWKLDGSGNCY